MVFNIFLVTMILAIFLTISIGLLTQYLHGKSKLNKFRKWWSKHIVDLDDRYNG